MTISCKIPLNEALEQTKLNYSKRKEITGSMRPKGNGILRWTPGCMRELFDMT